MGKTIQLKADLFCILAADEHEGVRRSLKSFLETQPGLQVLDATCGHDRLIEEVGRRKPQLVLLELALSSGDGFGIIQGLRSRFPDLLIIVLSLHSEHVYAERAIRAGANGYVMKSDLARNLLPAITAVRKGEVFVSDVVRQGILKHIRTGGTPPEDHLIDLLSNRELEVFHLIGRGYTLNQIGELLNISIKTLETHRSHIKRKLHLPDNQVLTHRAHDWVNEHHPA